MDGASAIGTAVLIKGDRGPKFRTSSNFGIELNHLETKEYRLQLRKPHLGDFHLVCFVITAKMQSSRKWSKVFLKAGSLQRV